MQRTKIEWCTHVWNPTTGCSKGCDYCYARRIAHRFKRSFEPMVHPEKLWEPLSLRKPSRIFVDSASDLFDPAIPWSFVRDVYTTMAIAYWHKYFILTKQADRMRAWASGMMLAENTWWGVSVTGPGDAWRIAHLLATPAVHRFISFEPLLESTKLPLGWNGKRRMGDGLGHFWAQPFIDWAIIGAQTGRDAQPIDPQSVADLTAQCDMAGVPVFHKDSIAHWGFNRRDMP